METNKLRLVGDLINNAYARARKAFREKDVKGYQNLALSQASLGVEFLDVNLDGTQQIQVKPQEMLDFLPDVVHALQEVTALPLCFDNPSVNYQRVALKNYDRKRSGRPIVDSIAASREHLDEMIELARHLVNTRSSLSHTELEYARERMEWLAGEIWEQAARGGRLD